jgi:hypothetical protein
MVEKDSSGRTIAKITKIENYERGNEEAEIYLTLEVNIQTNKLTGVTYFKNKPLALGGPIELNVDNIIVVGQVVDNQAPSNGYPTKVFTTTLKARNLEPHIYEKIKPGLTMFNRSTQEPIVVITSVKYEDSQLQPVALTNSSKYLYTYSSSNNKDVTMTAQITAYQLDGKWFFSGHQNLKPSNTFNSGSVYIYTSDINLYGLELLEIHESN